MTDPPVGVTLPGDKHDRSTSRGRPPRRVQFAEGELLTTAQGKRLKVHI